MRTVEDGQDGWERLGTVEDGWGWGTVWGRDGDGRDRDGRDRDAVRIGTFTVNTRL